MNELWKPILEPLSKMALGHHHESASYDGGQKQSLIEALLHHSYNSFHGTLPCFRFLPHERGSLRCFHWSSLFALRWIVDFRFRAKLLLLLFREMIRFGVIHAQNFFLFREIHFHPRAKEFWYILLYIIVYVYYLNWNGSSRSGWIKKYVGVAPLTVRLITYNY